MADQLDAAIAAAATPTERRAQVNVTILSTGRIVSIDVPADIADGEIAEFMGWCGTALLNAARNERAKTGNGRILVAGRLPS
jgi:hypothetical protein